LKYLSAPRSLPEASRKTAGLLCLILVLAAPGTAAAAVALKGVRMHEAPEYTRVVFDISGVPSYELFRLDNPARVVVDLDNVEVAAGFDPAPAAMGRKRVRAVRGSPRGDGYRVVLDINGTLEPRSFTLEPVAPYGHRLVVDLYATTEVEKPSFVPKPEGKRDVIVAVDAGHGGDDPGAIGPGGVREKDVVMSMAKRLARKLDATEGYRAVMIRTGDYYLAHRKRTALAREAGAHLFVSLHADAFKQPSVYGASVYTLSDRGASSETARWLAESENSSDLIGGVEEVVSGPEEDYLLKTILDVSMDANREHSIEVGAHVLARLEGITRLHKKRVEQAGFLVLKSPDVPSILIETGFISNPQEASRLKSAAFQDKVAEAVAGGIRTYMSSRAPEGTLVAWRRDQGEQRYTISRGDTLSGIAVRYGTSARRIREVNGLSNDRIRVGQVITIPAS
jgi:N-acetylmuramoyl-L-alanine amidase